MTNPKPARLAHTIAAAFTLLAMASPAVAADKTYRYYRFLQTQLRGAGANSIQLSEFELKHGTTVVSLASATVTNPGGNTPTNEGIDKVKDLSVDSKWLDFNKKEIVIDFGVDTTIDRYNFATANDSTDRDPVSWTFSGSADGSTWVVLDIQSNYPTTTARKTYEAGFILPADVLPAINLFKADATIQLNGNSNNLDWEVDLANTVSINQGIGTVNAIDSASISPPNNADTKYTLTATNAGGSRTADVYVRTVVGGAITARHVRFTPVKLRDGATANSIQLSEFFFVSNGTVVTPASVENPGGNSPTTEGPAKLIDGDNSTKWLDFNKRGLVFHFAADTQFDSYGFGTANDFEERDPVRWLIESSLDGTNWTLVENVTAFDYAMPKARQTSTPDIPLPGTSLAPYLLMTGDAPNLVAGQPLVLSWTGFAGLSASIDQGVGSVPVSGSISVTPTVDTTYTLTLTGSGGRTVTGQFSVHIVTPTINTIAYANFDASDAELSLLGSATVVNDFANIPAPANAKRLRITPNTASQAGGAWFRKRMHVGDGFETNFALHLLSITGNGGADGMCFVVQNHPNGNGAMPAGGHEDGLPSQSLAVSFDSFINGTEPSAAMVEIWANGTVVASANLGDFPGISLGGTSAAPDLTKTSGTAAPYAVKVTYVPGDLDVYVDGVQVIANAAVNLGTLAATDAAGRSYVGFLGRTGGLFEAHDVTSWYLTEGAPSPPLQLVAFTVNPTGQVSFTWLSTPGKTYRITASNNLSNWTTFLKTGIAASSGAQTTDSATFTPSTRGFFRVEEE